MIRYGAVTKPHSDAAAQDTLNSPSVERVGALAARIRGAIKGWGTGHPHWSPLARLSYVDDNFNKREHEREGDTLQ